MNEPDQVIYEEMDCWNWPEAKALAATIAMLEPQQFLLLGSAPAVDEVGTLWERVIQVTNYGDDAWLVEIPGREMFAESGLPHPHLTDEVLDLLRSRGFTPPTGDPAAVGHPLQWQWSFTSWETWQAVDTVVWLQLEVYDLPDPLWLSRVVGGNLSPDDGAPCLHYLEEHIPPGFRGEEGCVGHK